MAGDLHVYPIGDLRDHEMTRECWCRPTEADDDPFVLLHHSMDGREAYEEGRRKPS